MLPHLAAKSAENSHGKLFWMLIVGLMVGQFVAFWMLCAHQVRKAEVGMVADQRIHPLERLVELVSFDRLENA